MEPNSLRQMSANQLFELLLKTTEEYVALHSNPDSKAITAKRIELFQIYQVIEEKGLPWPSKNITNLN